ncbi:disease resistance protein (TIR-NBS-LRR class) family [Artemisia annua]|uniref:Disease resistance protein (TIR-NBS-LRR class) family n=1 Tax=Artemisia annua TaxID=35608 RepID=A0A2U1KPA3_ARTAN|nr:disease resistance protein (TIR-NBS-LRR class) family [Artemisia annua]
MASSSSASSFQPWKYDVFLSFRGEDTRKTFVDHLYKALEDRMVRTYKDDITLPRGESVGPALLEAIEESHFAVIVFSKNYADSSWCLDELVHIMKCRAERGLTVIPIFYDVEPTEVRKQKGDFGKLTKMSAWRKLFAKKETLKVEMWRKALVDASNNSGWEPKNVANGHEAAVIQKIVDEISDKLLSSNYSNIDEELVGMTDRVNDLISRLEIGTGGVRMVGIWGIGGGGKTTLATSVYMKIKDRFQGHCIVDNIRDESSKHGRTTSQAKILSTLLETQVVVQSEQEGKCLIKSRLCHSNVLILLDDVDDRKQLEALAGSHKWFGDGSRIIITTRDEHVLRTRKVDHIYPVILLSQDDGIRLFKKHAYNEEEPLKDFGELSLCVVSYAHGLPLALKVLGSFLYDKDEKEWMSTLDRLKEIPESEILEKLKTSYDGLKTIEKELFLDIACFFRRRSMVNAMEIFEACGFHPDIGIKVLIQKALKTINYGGYFDMHDLVQEMVHYIVRGEHPNNPEKHSRVWIKEEINRMCLGDTTMENDKTEVICPYNIDHPLLYSKIVPNMKKLRWLIMNKCTSEVPDYLPTELRYIEWDYYPGSQFPDNFQPTNLVVLKMRNGLQTKLWKDRKHLPHLKELRLSYMENLVSTPDFDGLPCLQELKIHYCDRLKEINLSQLTVLVHLDLSNCNWLEKLPEFPPSLVIFKANGCKRLTDIGDVNRNCKWLCTVSVMNGGVLVNGNKLLQSMLQGKAIENHSIVLLLEGLQIPREFRPRLRAGRKCTLQLPQNWCNDFCGFLMCAPITYAFLYRHYPKITMSPVTGGWMGIDSADDMVWKESVRYKQTWVGYVSFASLRHHVPWLDETQKAVSLYISGQYLSGFGVSLVPRISGSGPTDTSPAEYYSEFPRHKKIDFKPAFLKNGARHFRREKKR